MPSTFTPNRDYELPATGEEAGTWGEILNANFSKIDANFGGSLSLSLSSANVTLTADQAENLIYKCTGTLTANVAVIFPEVGGQYIVSNETTGAFSLSVRTTANTGSAVVPQGARVIVYTLGSAMYFAETRFDTIPVGVVVDFAGITVPANYAVPAGQALSRTTFSALLAALTSTQSVVHTIGSPILTGFSSTENFAAGQPIEGLALSVGTTIISVDSATRVTVSSLASGSGTTPVTVFPFGNGNGTTTFNLPDYRGRVAAGRDNLGGTAANRLTITTITSGGGNALGGSGGAQTHTLTEAQLAAHTHTATTTVTGGTLVTGVQQYATLGGSAPNQAVTGVATPVGTTTNASTGSGTAHNNVQPTLLINKIMRVV